MESKRAAGRIAAGRNRSSKLVALVASRIEERLLARRHGGFGVDLDTDPEDPTKTDLVLALAAERLVRKYNQQLVVCRYRERINIAWRADTYASVNQQERARLDGAGFFGGPELSFDDLRTGVDPGDVGHPNAPDFRRRLEAARRHRVATWTAQGWRGDPGWKDAGGDPASVDRLREQMRGLVRDGKVNIGGVEIQWQEPRSVIT